MEDIYKDKSGIVLNKLPPYDQSNSTHIVEEQVRFEKNDKVRMRNSRSYKLPLLYAQEQQSRSNII